MVRTLPPLLSSPLLSSLFFFFFFFALEFVKRAWLKENGFGLFQFSIFWSNIVYHTSMQRSGMAQSEKDSHSKNLGAGKKKLTIRYLLYTKKTFRKPNEQLFPQ